MMRYSPVYGILGVTAFVALLIFILWVLGAI